MQQETLSVVHRRTLVLAGLGVVDYVALPSLSEAAVSGFRFPEPEFRKDT